MNRSQALLATFSALYGGFSPKEFKRNRKFACTLCDKAIPPGKPDRRCKECRSKELAIIDEDESSPLKKFSNPSEWCRHIKVHATKAPIPVDGEEPKDPLAIVYEKEAQK